MAPLAGGEQTKKQTNRNKMPVRSASCPGVSVNLFLSACLVVIFSLNYPLCHFCLVLCAVLVFRRREISKKGRSPRAVPFSWLRLRQVGWTCACLVATGAQAISGTMPKIKPCQQTCFAGLCNAGRNQPCDCKDQFVQRWLACPGIVPTSSRLRNRALCCCRGGDHAERPPSLEAITSTPDGKRCATQVVPRPLE